MRAYLIAAAMVILAAWAALAPQNAEARNPECFASGATAQDIVCAYLDHVGGAVRTGVFSPAAPTFADRADLGGIGTSALSCVSWGERHDCFVKATDDTLYSFAYLGGRTHSGWAGLGAPRGGLRGDPSCVAWAPLRIDCLAQGADGAIWHLFWNGATWSSWQSVGGQWQGSPRCFSRTTERIDCFVRGADGQYGHLTFDGRRWRTRAAPVTTGVRAFPDCAVFITPTLSCVFNVDGILIHKSWNGTRWTDRVGPPRPEARFPNEFDCASGDGGQTMVCAVRTVFIGTPAVAISSYRAGDAAWSPWALVTLLDVHEISCASSAQTSARRSHFLCAFAGIGGGGELQFAHWAGGRASSGSMLDVRYDTMPETAVGLDYARFRGP